MFGAGDVRFFDLSAPLYDRLMPPADREALVAGFDRATRPIDRVLDVGGGTGRAAAAITGPTVTVIDASLGMVSRARSQRGLSAIVGDAGRLPIQDECVDAVMIVDALHHLPDRTAAVQAVSRVLAPGGVFVIREFDPAHPLGRALALGERLIGMDSRFVTPDDLATELYTAGFTASVLDRGFGYTVVGVKPPT